MAIKKWLLQNLKHENWFSHGVMFITTIIGILIALELDKSRQQSEQLDKLNQYRIRLDNELKVNKQALIDKKKWLLRDYGLIELENDLKLQPSGEVILAKPKLDSLYDLDSAFKSMVTAIKELPGNLVAVKKNNYFATGNLTLDTWESIKGSDVMQELSANELILYIDIFHKLNSFNDYFASLTSQPNLYTKRKLREIILNIDDLEGKIDYSLSQISDARNSADQVTEIPLPKDTSKLSRKIKDLKSKTKNDSVK